LARGDWVAVVDNDDLIEPDRLKRLCDTAQADSADVAADNLLTFYEGGARAEHPHLALTAPAWIDAAAYAESNIMLRGGRQLGYLKPIFRRTALGATRYDESLRIGEDADLVLRLLIGGARMRIYPECGYHYRKHAGSISHRLTPQTLDAMLAAHERLDARGDARLQRALTRQGDALHDARAFEDLVAALKARDFGGALAAALKRPAALALLHGPLLARLKR
jgi:succinoglycan biosynthesis protein ExoO